MIRINGMFCTSQKEGAFWVIRAVRGLMQATYREELSDKDIRKLVKEYDLRARSRLHLYEQKRERPLSQEELAWHGLNPNYNPSEWLQESDSWETVTQFKYGNYIPGFPFAAGFPRFYRGKTFTLIDRIGLKIMGATVNDSTQYRAEGLYWNTFRGVYNEHSVAAWKEE